jgi:periplasmic divalent cation tolerance protein
MHIVVLITAPDKKEARRIARKLIGQKLAACVNIVGGVESLFWWEGKIDAAGEVLLVVKSKREKLPSLIKLVTLIHSYDVPEIIALPIIAGEKKYLRWLDDSLGKAA